MKRDRQFKLLEQQKQTGEVRVQTMFLAMEEQLRNEADVLREASIIRDARMREQIVATLEKAANFCGMHSFAHLGEVAELSELPLDEAALAGASEQEGD